MQGNVVSLFPTRLTPQTQAILSAFPKIPGKPDFPGSHLILCFSLSDHLILVTCKGNSSIHLDMSSDTVHLEEAKIFLDSFSHFPTCMLRLACQSHKEMIVP